MQLSEYEAGPNQTIVVYAIDDTGSEVDPAAAFSAVAADAGTRAAQGWRIVSTAVIPLRHSAVAFGREGSGYETKAALAVVYGK